MLDKPVVFFIFKRPDTTKLVFEAIRQARPTRLYIFADGPRKEVAREDEMCRLTREVVQNVDWPCEVYREYSDMNLGVDRRIVSGLDLVFSKEEEAIILEDDCLPSQSFFRFCSELLDRYRDDNRIMAISGSNFHYKRFQSSESYYFSRFHVPPWGWATWRRAWKLYDDSVSLWPEIKKGDRLRDILRHREAEEYWWLILEDCYHKGPNYAWDYVWTFTNWVNNGFIITPYTNMVKNIGYRSDAVHTNRVDRLANIEAEDISFPLNHPKVFICHEAADQVYKDFKFGKNARDFYMVRLLNAIMQKKPLTAPLLDRSITKVAIFGTLDLSKYLIEECRTNGIEVVTLLDNEKTKEGTLIDGIPVYSPSYFANSPDKIGFKAIISTVLGRHENDIIRKLSDQFPDVPILSWIDLLAMNKY